MRVLIADDDPVSRYVLSAQVTAAGHEPIQAADGEEAKRLLADPEGPTLAIIDWLMPGLDGLSLCRWLRARRAERYVYAIVLTVRDSKADLATGLASGADDFIAKPWDPVELVARLAVGVRTLELQQQLRTKIVELEEAVTHIKHLEGLLRICMHCRRIQASPHSWEKLETYVQKHSDAVFSHGICDTCFEQHHSGH
jgi:phosphoserine phosphatase RsbU/P